MQLVCAFRPWSVVLLYRFIRLWCQLGGEAVGSGHSHIMVGLHRVLHLQPPILGRSHHRPHIFCICLCHYKYPLWKVKTLFMTKDRFFFSSETSNFRTWFFFFLLLFLILFVVLFFVFSTKRPLIRKNLRKVSAIVDARCDFYLNDLYFYIFVTERPQFFLFLEYMSSKDPLFFVWRGTERPLTRRHIVRHSQIWPKCK